MKEAIMKLQTYKLFEDGEVLVCRDDVLKALEDIEAEIEEAIDATPYNYHDYETGRIDAFEYCLEIIDKHINGKEAEE